MAPTRGKVALACCALIFGLAGCTDDDGGGSGAAATPSAHAGFGGPASAPAPSPVVSDVGDVIFRTPSKNIVCSLTATNARCDIIHKTWTPPPKPATCDFDWGNGMYVDAGGKAGFTCASDTVIGAATVTLEYGAAYRNGPIVCDSESTGMTCRDAKTGRGFTLASGRYSSF